MKMRLMTVFCSMALLSVLAGGGTAEASLGREVDLPGFPRSPDGPIVLPQITEVPCVITYSEPCTDSFIDLCRQTSGCPTLCGGRDFRLDAYPVASGTLRGCKVTCGCWR